LPILAAGPYLAGRPQSKPAQTPAPEIPSTPAREWLLFDAGWKFALGDAADIKGDFGYGSGELFAKAGSAAGAIAPNFNDSSWRTIDLPHDWAVELEFVNVPDNALKDHGFKPIGRQFPKTTIGWYRRAFLIPKTDESRRITVKFDGVFRDAIVWLNGHYLGRNLSGYSEFSFDITDYVRYGQRNVMAVRVDASQMEGWFYEGAGIYRHVWLLKQDPVHIPEYGIFVHSKGDANSALVTAETDIWNQLDADVSCDLQSDLLDEQGKKVAGAITRGVRLAGWERRTLKQEITVANPQLWSLETPHLYKLASTVLSQGKAIDQEVTSLGIRGILFDKDKGFFLNGKPVKIKGVCDHQDHAGVGSALPDRLQYYRIGLLKEMGDNGYRTSHNPPTNELLDACDRLGMLVMDENRLMGSSPEMMGQFERLVLRDRNHPSVIIWSLGNEEGAIQNTDTGRRLAESLLRRQKQLDPTRLSTYAANNGNQYEGINSVVPVRGFNYMTVSNIDKYRQDHLTQILLGSEEASTLCTRGVYANDKVRGYVSDYDANAPGWGSKTEPFWKFYAAREWLAGAFVWTGFDYRGEPTPYGWPCINSHFGIMDMCGFPKNNYYYYQAWWSDKDVLHIYPHWNWQGKEGEPIDVWCQSNAETVELFLNGKSLGQKTMESNSHLEWKVPYQPGTLEARGTRKGRALTAKVETTGAAASIVLTPDRSSILGDGEDISVVNVTVLDAQNREVPAADNLIRFEIGGYGKILGVGNGDPSSHEADKILAGAWQRSLFNGKCQIILQSMRQPGTIQLRAASQGLQDAMIEVRAASGEPRPYVKPFNPETVTNLARGGRVEYKSMYDARYAAAGADALVDGMLGDTDYQDGLWQGFEKNDFEAEVDLIKITPISQIRCNFLQDIEARVFPPTSVEYSVSEDGKDFKIVATIANDVPADLAGARIKQFTAKLNKISARFIRVRAKNIGVCPPGHRQAGQNARLFIDEIIVQ
ncbi:MAG: beta-galactosidase GalA, partial [Acidobacteriota bacterium]